jgi:Protein of unknown function (DUF2789)
MESPTHSLNNLFEQLGLSSDQVEIERFIKSHSPLATDIFLPDAPFWTQAQASFLREEILNDADWAGVIDQLNSKLHSKN